MQKIFSMPSHHIDYSGASDLHCTDPCLFLHLINTTLFEKHQNGLIFLPKTFFLTREKSQKMDEISRNGKNKVREK